MGVWVRDTAIDNGPDCRGTGSFALALWVWERQFCARGRGKPTSIFNHIICINTQDLLSYPILSHTFHPFSIYGTNEPCNEWRVPTAEVRFIMPFMFIS